MKTKDQIDWRRLQAALKQHERRNACARTTDESVAIVRSWADILGEKSLTRQMLYKIGIVLLEVKTPEVIIPVCPDYTHSDGKYDFKGLGNEVSLLALKQESFIEAVESLFPLRVHFLIADQEAKDTRIAAAVGKTERGFKESIEGSLAAMRRRFSPKGWLSDKMTSFSEKLVPLEKALEQELLLGKEMDMIRMENLSRSAMYDRICRSMDSKERLERTLRTASQYLALGKIAAERKVLIANHSTVNLRYYCLAGAALLHNPVCVY